jgi:hypothetical protein
MLDRVLAELRARAPEHRRWWSREHGAAGAAPDWSTAPWSDEDEARAAELGSVDPWWMRSVAGELERAHTDLRDVGAELARMAGSAIGGAASSRCALLAATSHERATEAAMLASGARTAGDRAGELLDTVVHRLTDVVDAAASREPGPWAVGPWASAPWEPGPGGPDPHRIEDGPGRHGEGFFDGYEAVLRAVRTELSSALELLPTLVGIHPADRPVLSEWAAEPGRGSWVPEPGTGPQLPGTDARRVETDIGVRIARLPDGPTGH